MADGHSYSDAVERLATWCVRQPRFVYALVLALFVGSGLLVTRLKVDPSPEAYLQGTEEWRYYEAGALGFGVGQGRNR